MAAGVGFIFALFAVLFAFIALVMIWQDGRPGARNAMLGLLAGLIALVPLAFVIYGVVQFPRLNDITTDIVDPPLFFALDRTPTWGENGHQLPDAADRRKQREAYPDIVSRRFPLTPAQMFDASRVTVEPLGWEIVSERAPSEQVEIVFALPDDVVIRVTSDPYGARLDIRSASRFGRHDLGTNARRIREFFEALDEAVLDVAAEGGAEEGEAVPSEDQPASQ